MEQTMGACVLVKGRVQGVFFRVETKRAAERIGVIGWVKNLPDGRVEAYFEGEGSLVEAVVKWCAGGPPYSVVEDVEIRWCEASGEFNSFRIIY